MASFIHKLIRAKVPREASRFRGEGLEGLAWVTGPDFVYVAFDPAGVPHCGRLAVAGAEQPDGTVAAPFERRPGWRLDLSVLAYGEPLAPELRCDDPGAMAIVDRFAGTIDGDAVDAMIARGVRLTGNAYAYVAGMPGRLGDRVDLCMRHEWAIGVLVEAHANGDDLGDGAVPGAHAGLGGTGSASLRIAAACILSARRRGIELDPERVWALVRALDGADVPGFIVNEFPRLLPLLSDLPPGPILPADPDPNEALALLCVLYLAASHARYLGRPAGRMIPRFGTGWVAGLMGLSDKAGAAWVDLNGDPLDEWPDPEDLWDEDGEGIAVGENLLGLLRAVTDMACAFEEQVVVPALIEADPGRAAALEDRAHVAYPTYAGQAWLQGDPAALAATPLGIALRLLARDKGLVGFLEGVGDWHARRMQVDGVATRVNHDVTWTRAFEPWIAPNGLALSSIHTAADLTREGEEMRHCVAGYLGRCLRGACVIVSIRDRDGGVATMELAFSGGNPQVVQLMGPGNAQPSNHAKDASAALLSAIRSGAVRIARDVVSWGGTPVRDHLIYVGHFAAMRDGWGRFLAREVRAAPAAEFVAAGLRAPPPAKARTRRAVPSDRPAARGQRPGAR